MGSGNPGGLSKQLGSAGGGGSSPSAGSFRCVVPGVGSPISLAGNDRGICTASLSSRTSLDSPAAEVSAWCLTLSAGGSGDEIGGDVGRDGGGDIDGDGVLFPEMKVKDVLAPCVRLLFLSLDEDYRTALLLFYLSCLDVMTFVVVCWSELEVDR